MMFNHFIQLRNMKITQLLIYLFIWCQAAETLDQLTDLGQNVTINCDLDEGDIYWFLLKVPDPPVMILRTLSTTSLFFNTTFRQKYSVQNKNHLFINNITVNELGVYYCMKTDTPPKFSSGIRLQINEESSDSQIEVNCVHQNHTVLKFIEHDQTHWMIIIVISALLLGVMIIVVMASGCYHCAKNQKPKDARLQQTKLEDTMNYTLYTAVSFSSL